VHPHLTRDHEACPRLANDAEGCPLTWILAEAVADGGGPAEKVRKRPVWAIMSRYAAALVICSGETLRCRTTSWMPRAIRCPYPGVWVMLPAVRKMVAA
jgi:hypothetical protein